MTHTPDNVLFIVVHCAMKSGVFFNAQLISCLQSTFLSFLIFEPNRTFVPYFFYKQLKRTEMPEIRNRQKALEMLEIFSKAAEIIKRTTKNRELLSYMITHTTLLLLELNLGAEFFEIHKSYFPDLSDRELTDYLECAQIIRKQYRNLSEDILSTLN